ncbi:MAG: hypothetical protein HPY66_2722 [Firmicutes bacterium]|nr:hypothetical protein [Bacillota bacterium]
MFRSNTQEWLLPRINPKCENCNNNEYYNIYTTYIKPFLILSFGEWHPIFQIVCPVCGETIELDIDEYLLLSPFIKLNNLLETGKTDEYEYKYRLEVLESKRLYR